MAISQTMSNPTDWILQYQSEVFSDQIPPTTVSSTTTAAARNNTLSPDQGRVSKPLRRRSRASRRTPTTLLNTDATNFRAMVQQFTGGPAAAYAPRPNGDAALNYMEQHIDPARGFRAQQYPNVHMQQHVFAMNNNSTQGGGGRGGLPPQAAAPPPNENVRDYDDYMV